MCRLFPQRLLRSHFSTSCQGSISNYTIHSLGPRLIKRDATQCVSPEHVGQDRRAGMIVKATRTGIKGLPQSLDRMFLEKQHILTSLLCFDVLQNASQCSCWSSCLCGRRLGHSCTASQCTLQPVNQQSQVQDQECGHPGDGEPLL